jgi:hypothetical protein
MLKWSLKGVYGYMQKGFDIKKRYRRINYGGAAGVTITYIPYML